MFFLPFFSKRTRIDPAILNIAILNNIVATLLEKGFDIFTILTSLIQMESSGVQQKSTAMENMSVGQTSGDTATVKQQQQQQQQQR